jgi:hypothetical protein
MPYLYDAFAACLLLDLGLCRVAFVCRADTEDDLRGGKLDQMLCTLEPKAPIGPSDDSRFLVAILGCRYERNGFVLV